MEDEADAEAEGKTKEKVLKNNWSSSTNGWLRIYFGAWAKEDRASTCFPRGCFSEKDFGEIFI